MGNMLADRRLQRPTALDRSQLAAVVRGYARDPRRWRHAVRFSERARQWTRLRANAQLDVWLLTWWQDQATDLHDHGAAAAAFTVVRGRLREVRVEANGRLGKARLNVGPVHWVPAGVVHDVYNRDPEPAVSIHAYSPPLTEMTFYRRARHRVTPVRTIPADHPEAR